MPQERKHPRRHLPLLVAIALVASTLAACGPPPPPRTVRASDLRDISEGRALELMAEVASEVGVRLSSGWEVAGIPFTVDARIATTAYGIEWVSPQDRRDDREREHSVLEAPNPRQLQVLPGADDDANVQILIVDHTSYRYDPDLERVQLGSRGAAEAEASLRSYVRDFFEYVRGQGAL